MDFKEMITRGTEVILEIQGHPIFCRVLQSFDTQATIIINIDDDGYTPSDPDSVTLRIDGVPIDKLEKVGERDV